jgi:hypothetical protein
MATDIRFYLEHNGHFEPPVQPHTAVAGHGLKVLIGATIFRNKTRGILIHYNNLLPNACTAIRQICNIRTISKSIAVEHAGM